MAGSTTDTGVATDQVIVLPAVLDLRAATPLAAELMGRASTTLDASLVRKLGGQCLQVLLSARAACEQANGQFRITTPSADFTDGAALLGASFIISEA